MNNSYKIYASKDEIPSRVSQLENDSNFVTEERIEDLSKTVAYRTGDGEFTGDVIAGGNGGEAPISLKGLNNLINIRVPAWTAEDEGKILKIVNGVPTWDYATLL